MNKALRPLLYALLIVGGVFIGKFLSNPSHTAGLLPSSGGSGLKKVRDVLALIKEQYVDEIDEDLLANESIEKILENLDPHSAFIPAENLAAATEPLQGAFEGIGIEFHLQQDSVMVVSVIPGGPSDEAGIIPGDRIVKVNGKSFFGEKMTNDSVLHTLRGNGGTTVEIAVLRRNNTTLTNYKITRGKIPLNSLDAAYMITGTTGYIKLSRFGARTYEEFYEALKEQVNGGMKALILDLRGNPGGYMDAATEIVDEMLGENKMIVYTKGRARPRQEYKAKKTGLFENGPIIILIDEGSASASEIVAGALQDWDRATVVGRRSFGKGLVQEEASLPDGSAIRLTVARYYTPTGRSIQKPYINGNEAYQEDLLNRMKHGELINSDSIKFPDSLKFKTPGGRIVYGGGGIMPDEFVPIDTMHFNSYYENMIASGVVTQAAYNFVDENRKSLSQYANANEYSQKFELPAGTKQKLLSQGDKYRSKVTAAETTRADIKLMRLMKALIARQLFRDQGYFIVLNSEDETVKKALELTK
ncbi:MAG: S41 family peptidase [Bacteroidetes bacterium]|nr:S41 family peptidase [Bacteroidota bacterium]